MHQSSQLGVFIHLTTSEPSCLTEPGVLISKRHWCTGSHGGFATPRFNMLKQLLSDSEKSKSVCPWLRAHEYTDMVSSPPLWLWVCAAMKARRCMAANIVCVVRGKNIYRNGAKDELQSAACMLGNQNGLMQ